MRICVDTSCELVVGLRSHFCTVTVRGVRGLGSRMLTLGHENVSVRRGSGAPSTWVGFKFFFLFENSEMRDFKLHGLERWRNITWFALCLTVVSGTTLTTDTYDELSAGKQVFSDVLFMTLI